MANLGTIGFNRSLTAPHGRPGSQLAISPFSTSTALVPKWVSIFLLSTATAGSTSVSGSRYPYAQVYIYQRSSGKLIAAVKADGAGAFSVKRLPVASNAYFAIMEQPATVPGTYNLAALDHLSQT